MQHVAAVQNAVH